MDRLANSGDSPSTRGQPGSPPALPGWRFSLRELFLLTTTAASLIALVLLHWNRGPAFPQPSLLVEEFVMPPHMERLAKTYAPRGFAYEDTGGTYTSSAGLWSRAIGYRITLAPDLRDAWIQRLRQDALEMTKRQGDRVLMERPLPSDTSRDGFFVLYEGSYRKGQLFVRPVDLSDEQLDVMIFVYEHVDRP